MKISELFGITKSQHELDFVDVDIDSDIKTVILITRDKIVIAVRPLFLFKFRRA